MEDGNRIDDTPIHNAVREALANCVINADYFGRGGVVVKRDENAIVLENPGDIRAGKEQMLKGGISDPRNKALMKMFNMINIGERAGSGVPDILSVWKKDGFSSPEIEETYGPDRTKVTLPLVSMIEEKQATKSSDKKSATKISDKLSAIKISDKTAKTREHILDLLRKNKTLTTTQVAEKINLQHPRTRQLLNELVEENLVVAHGSNKNRTYSISNEEA